jgi:hypothetical protein
MYSFIPKASPPYSNTKFTANTTYSFIYTSLMLFNRNYGRSTVLKTGNKKVWQDSSIHTVTC